MMKWPAATKRRETNRSASFSFEQYDVISLRSLILVRNFTKRRGKWWKKYDAPFYGREIVFIFFYHGVFVVSLIGHITETFHYFSQNECAILKIDS